MLLVVSALLGICVLFVLPPAHGQSGRGAFTGVVKDSSGAVVPGADITITEKSTGVVTQSTTTEAGVYRVPYLPPGKYRIQASMTGFKTAVGDNVDLLMSQTLTIDFTFEIGQVSDQVTVTARTPLLESSTSEIGITSTEKEFHTWPIIVGDGTRQLQSFIFRSMPGTQGNEFAGTINGGQYYSHEILIEGISIGRFDLNGGSNNEFTPTMDAVSEFKLQTGVLSAQYGNTQTALANFGMKSGTNDYHGTAFWFHKEKAFNANSWGSNLSGLKKTGVQENNLGLTFGGPVQLPGLYDGKDRTHWFFSSEADRFKDQTISGFDNLPVAPFKQGDFSILFDPGFTKDSRSGNVIGTDALGRPVRFGQIYDPTTSRQLANGAWIRDPFLNNFIPQNKISRVSSNVLKFDLPNPQLFQLRRNNPRVSGAAPFLDIDNWSIKLDHSFTKQHRVSYTFVDNDRIRRRFGGVGQPRLLGEIPGPPTAGDKTQATPGWMVRLAEDWNINATRLNHFAFGYNRFRNANQSNSYLSGKDWATELGLINVGRNTFPVIRFSGFDSTLTGQFPIMGNGGTSNAPNGSTIFGNDFTWIRGRHSFRFGGEHRRYYLNSQSVQNAGDYTFHNENTGLPGFTNSTGFAYASFLLGDVRNAGLGFPFLTPGIRSRTTAFYVHDDWKITSRLTLNLGLRWDIPTTLTETASRMAGLNPAKPNPGADNFPGAFEVLGDCKGCSGRSSFANIYWKELSPRAGFAWAPTEKLVLRGGYGINYAPPLQDGFDFPYTSGFDGSNPIISRSGRFPEDPSYLWDNPYPPFTKSLPNTDPSFLNGNDIGYYLPQTNKYPRVQNWNVGVQYEFPWQTKLEVNYVGNKAIRLKDNYLYSLNQVNSKWLSLGDTLLDDIAEHPEIKKPFPSFEGTVARALRPFPQYEAVTTHRLNDGYSNYHSLQVTSIKRTSAGLSFLAVYTFSKALGNADSAIGDFGGYGQDFYNRKADYSVTSFNYPHDFKLTWIYDLPFGPGRRLLQSGPLSYLVGGWSMSAIQRYQSGGPLSIGTDGYDFEALFNPGFRGDVLLPHNQQVLGEKPSSIDPENGTPYLNPTAFGNPPKTAKNVPIRLGNSPRYLPDLRGFAIYTEDFTLMKRTGLRFREGANFELRMDAINIFNRTRLQDPATNAADPSSFGRIFGKFNSGGPRTIQLGARINF